MKLVFLIGILLFPVYVYCQKPEIAAVHQIKFIHPISLSANLDSLFKEVTSNQLYCYEEYSNGLKTGLYLSEEDLKNGIGEKWVYDKKGKEIKSESNDVIVLNTYDNLNRLTEVESFYKGERKIKMRYTYDGEICTIDVGKAKFREKIYSKNTTLGIEFYTIMLGKNDEEIVGEKTLKNKENQILESYHIFKGDNQLTEKRIYKKRKLYAILDVSNNLVNSINFYIW